MTMIAKRRAFGLVMIFSTLVIFSSCSEEIVETNEAIGGSCLSCHQGITDVHPFFALSCVDCHGGNDQVPIENDGTINIRSKELIRLSHVEAINPANWYKNGVDDEFFDPRLEQEGVLVGNLDQEMNEDLDYLRFINPGDLRVAGVGCGARSPAANAAMVCHAEVVYDTRRSMMANNSGVPTGAQYGNAQDVKAEAYGAPFAPFAERFDARDPRIGRIGYTFNYNDIDANFLLDENRFDRDELLNLANTENNDPTDNNAMAFPAPVFSRGVGPDATDPFAPTSGFTRDGDELRFESRAVEVLQYIPRRELFIEGDDTALEARVIQIARSLNDDFRDIDDVTDALAGDNNEVPVFNPVDNVLRGFRAYHPLNWPGIAENFGAVDFFTGPNEGDAEIRQDPNAAFLNGFQNNPFGRARSSGCTACHIPYANDGVNREPIDRTVADNGRQATNELPFGMRVDLGQRFWPERHEIQRAVDGKTCAVCHAFVTRVDFAYTGIHENEQDNALKNDPQNAFLPLQKLGPINYIDQNGQEVAIFDNVAVWENGTLKNAGERDSEDTNGNGILDEGEDVNNNGILELADRVKRSDSADGRQQKFIYGGANGAVLMQDIHNEAGMDCVDCHGIQDIHGDGNIYTRNWDAVQVECDDCHGTATEVTDLIFSGPNGGTNMTELTTPFFDENRQRKKWFEVQNGAIIQNSRTTDGLSWRVPQLTESAASSMAAYTHNQVGANGNAHIAERANADGSGAEEGKMECYTCHSAVQPNCLSCHYQSDIAKPVQSVWYTPEAVNNVFFQLFGYIRSPFLLGRSGDVENRRITTYRSTMELHLSVAAAGDTVLGNFMTASQDNLSSMASNPYFPHVVRTKETKSCARCHTLKDDEDRITNDHLIVEALGQGSDRYENMGDWAMVAGEAGLDVIDVKRENLGARNVFPGFVFDDANIRSASITTGVTHDLAFVRGVSFENGKADGADVALVASDRGLSVIDVTGRDAPKYPPLLVARLEELGEVLSVDNTGSATSQFKRAVVLTDDELAVVDFGDALDFSNVQRMFEDFNQDEDPGATPLTGAEPPFDDDRFGGISVVGAIDHELEDVSRVRLFSTFAMVAHRTGVTLIDVSDTDRIGSGAIGTPSDVVQTFTTSRPARDMVMRGRFIFIATGDGGIEIFDAAEDRRVSRILHTAEDKADSRGVALAGTKLLVADGKNGLRVIDIVAPADPILERTILNPPGGGAPLDEANDVIAANVPVRSFAIVADGSHGIRAVNLTPSEDWRTRIAENSRAFKMSFERQDPYTPYDPLNRVTQVFTFPTSSPALTLARGHGLDRLADGLGNRLRDGWLIGASTLSKENADTMRSVVVKEVPGSVDASGDGLGCVVAEFDLGRVTVGEDGSTCVIE